MTSFLDELRADAEITRRAARKTIPVPPRDVILVRFRPPEDRDKLTPYIAKYRLVGALSGDEEKQLIVDCCDEIGRRNPDTGEFGPWDDQGPLRFDAGDERWGDDVDSARECVAKLYHLKDQPTVAAAISEMLIDWLTGNDAQALARVEKKFGRPAADAS